MFQMAGVGPMGGQFAFFNFYAREKVPLAIERYRNEIYKLMRVMDGHLANNLYLAGVRYSIADMAVYPWWDMLRVYSECERPALERWGAAMVERAAVVKGVTMLGETLRPEVVQAGMTSKMSDETYGLLYGRRQYNPEAQ